MGFEGAYGAELLAELEDLPNQFIGPERDGRCDLDGIFLRDEVEDEGDLSFSGDENGFELRVFPLR